MSPQDIADRIHEIQEKILNISIGSRTQSVLFATIDTTAMGERLSNSIAPNLYDKQGNLLGSDIRPVLNFIFDIVDNAFNSANIYSPQVHATAQSEIVMNILHANPISDDGKLYKEAVSYVLNNLYPEQTGLTVELDTKGLKKEAINLSSEYGVDAQRVPDILNSLQNGLNLSITQGSRNVASGYYINQDDEILLNQNLQKREALIRMGAILNPNDEFMLLRKYADPTFRQQFNKYWPEINAEIQLGEVDTENPSFIRGIGNVIEGMINPTPKNNQEWINTIIGATEKFPNANDSNPQTKREYQIFQAGVNYDDYADYRLQITDSDAVLKIIQKQLGFDKNKITPEALESLAIAFQEAGEKLTFDQFAQLNDPSTPPLNDQLFNLIVPSQEIDSLKNQKINLEIIKNETGYDSVVSDLLGLDGLNIGDPETGEKLEITAPDEFRKHISQILADNLNKSMTVKEAAKQVLTTMGISPEGKLVPKPQYYGTPIEYSDPETGRTTILGGTEGSRLERITEAPPITENELATSESYFHQSQIFQPLDFLLQRQSGIGFGTGFGTVDPLTNEQIIQQQYGLTPPMYVDPSLLGGAPGLPGFFVVEEPVYTDEDVATVLASRYSDKPELLQFLAPQLTSIAEAFRLSQRPGALTQESFLDDPTDATVQVSDPYQVMQDVPVIDEETGYQRRDAQGNFITESVPTYTVTPPTTLTGEYGQAVDDYTSSRAMFEMFEADRPKSIQEYINREASKLEKGFESSPLFEQQQKRLEQERQAEDARQRQQFVSQPVSIFGRRRR